MKITKISASYSQKKQLRQFEPIEIFAGAEAELTEEQTSSERDEAQDMLFDRVKNAVDRQLKKLLAEIPEDLDKWVPKSKV